MSLLFNTLSLFVIAFLPRSKRLLVSWLQSLSPVILEPNTYFINFYTCILHISVLSFFEPFLNTHVLIKMNNFLKGWLVRVKKVLEKDWRAQV